MSLEIVLAEIVTRNLRLVPTYVPRWFWHENYKAIPVEGYAHRKNLGTAGVILETKLESEDLGPKSVSLTSGAPVSALALGLSVDKLSRSKRSKIISRFRGQAECNESMDTYLCMDIDGAHVQRENILHEIWIWYKIR